MKIINPSCELWLQENPTAKQLPEKALKYLDKLADSYLNNEKEEEK